MKIKFIKDTNTFKQDEVAEVETLFANAFLAMGFAEAYKEDKPKTTKTIKKTAKQ